MMLLISSSKCPECKGFEFWTHGYDYKTHEFVHWCEDCDYEERIHSPELQEQFETLQKLVRERNNV